MRLVAEPGALEPRFRELRPAVRHVPSAEDTEPEKFAGPKFRMKITLEILPGFFDAKIAIAALHGYDVNKRAAVYPFLAKYLGLDVKKAINADGTVKEDMIVIEDQKALYPFDEKHPFPASGIKSNDGVKWDW